MRRFNTPLDLARIEANSLARCGRLVSPGAALYAAGADRTLETLWSIASRIAASTGCDPESLHRQLEEWFPRYATRSHALPCRSLRMAGIFAHA